MKKKCRQSAVLHICPTSSGLVLISLLHQQVARTLREEGQDTQLQDCWERQECKQVVPPRFLQSKHNNSMDNLQIRVRQLLDWWVSVLGLRELWDWNPAMPFCCSNPNLLRLYDCILQSKGNILWWGCKWSMYGIPCDLLKCPFKRDKGRQRDTLRTRTLIYANNEDVRLLFDGWGRLMLLRNQMTAGKRGEHECLLL